MRAIAFATLLTAFAVQARVKMLDLKKPPTTPPALVPLLLKEPKGKPSPAKVKLSLALDEALRTKGTALTQEAADQAIAVVLDGVFDHMAAGTDFYVWDKDTFSPRSDVLCRETAVLFPGRASPGFSKKFTKTNQGKRIDRGYLGSPCTVTVSTAPSMEAARAASAKGWAIWVHEVLAAEVDPKAQSQVARVGLTFISPPSGSAPPKWERPFYVGFALKPKADEPWALLSVEGPATKDWRQQPCNLCSTDGRANDVERHLRFDASLEVLRALDEKQPRLSDDEQAAFLIEGTNADAVGPKDKAWLQQRKADASAVVKGAVALKLVKLGEKKTPEELVALADALPHPWLKAQVVQQLVKAIGADLTAGAAATGDELKALSDAAVPAAERASNQVYETKVAGGFAKVMVTNIRETGFLYRKGDGGWVLVGPLK